MHLKIIKLNHMYNEHLQKWNKDNVIEIYLHLPITSMFCFSPLLLGEAG